MGGDPPPDRLVMRVLVGVGAARELNGIAQDTGEAALPPRFSHGRSVTQPRCWATGLIRTWGGQGFEHCAFANVRIWPQVALGSGCGAVTLDCPGLAQTQAVRA